MKFISTRPLFYDCKDLPPSLSESDYITINLAIPADAFVVTRTRLSLFDCEAFVHFSHWDSKEIELKHDSTWDGFGRAYYSSCDYQLTELHFTLYSVDELRRQIEAKMQQFEEHRDVMMPCLIEEVHAPSPLDFYFAENGWDGGLYEWIEDFLTKNRITRNTWVADDRHSCYPFEDKIFYLHQLAKQILSGYSPHVSAAKRPRCRSLLMATCHQLSGDDLLGH